MISAARINISLPEPLLAEVDLALLDPGRGSVRYGARSQLIQELLEGWVLKRRKEIQKEEAERKANSRTTAAAVSPSYFDNKETDNDIPF